MVDYQNKYGHEVNNEYVQHNYYDVNDEENHHHMNCDENDESDESVYVV